MFGLINRTVAYYQGLGQVEDFEWKTRGHDQPTDLGSRLQAAGLVAEEVETVMVGEAAALAVTVELPAGVVVRRVDRLPERAERIAAGAALQHAVFGGGPPTDEVLARLDRMGSRARRARRRVAGHDSEGTRLGHRHDRVVAVASDPKGGRFRCRYGIQLPPPLCVAFTT